MEHLIKSMESGMYVLNGQLYFRRMRSYASRRGAERALARYVKRDPIKFQFCKVVSEDLDMWPLCARKPKHK